MMPALPSRPLVDSVRAWEDATGFRVARIHRVGRRLTFALGRGLEQIDLEIEVPRPGTGPGTVTGVRDAGVGLSVGLGKTAPQAVAAWIEGNGALRRHLSEAGWGMQAVDVSPGRDLPPGAFLTLDRGGRRIALTAGASSPHARRVLVHGALDVSYVPLGPPGRWADGRQVAEVAEFAASRLLADLPRLEAALGGVPAAAAADRLRAGVAAGIRASGRSVAGHSVATLPGGGWLAFRLGLKPALRQVVPESAVAALRARVPALGVSERRYRVTDDQFVRPEAASRHVLVYAAHDPAVAEALVAIEDALYDEGRRLDGRARQDLERRLGLGLGYPECCVGAFLARQSGLTLNGVQMRAALAETVGPGHHELNHFLLHFFQAIAHYPCRYDCAPSLSLARSVLAELAREDPEACAAVRVMLRRPLLYLGEATQIAFEGVLDPSGRSLTYETAHPPASWPFRSGEARDPRHPERALAAFRRGRRLEVLDDAICVFSRRGEVIARFTPGPGAGFLAWLRA
jgi:hypothetical protein